MRTQLAALTRDAVRRQSARVCEQIESLPQFQSARCISAYLSIGNEVETHGLMGRLLVSGRTVCVPVFDGHQYRLSQVWDFDVDLHVGHYGILEPKVITPPAIEPDMWLVPGLAFDTMGNRLGRGKGYFDQLLTGSRGVKIGLAYDFQVWGDIAAESHDVCMDFLVTGTKILRCFSEGL